MEIRNTAHTNQESYRSFPISNRLENIRIRSLQAYLQIKFFGYSRTMDDYEGRKLRIFNQLNFLQLIAGFFIPCLGMIWSSKIPTSAWLIAFYPPGVSVLVLALNYFRRYEASQIAYFILYPLCISLVYLSGMNAGLDLLFIFFVILAVFFIQDLGFMLFAIAFSLISFFILSVVLQHFIYDVEAESKPVFLLNKFISLLFISYGVFLIKKEAGIYQLNILLKQETLHKTNEKIDKQRLELEELDAFKNKLFSIISHDLKSPMYALRNLFQNMQKYNLPAEEVKAMIPDVLVDLNYTTSLMENLLQWSKSQMQANAVNAQTVNITNLIEDVTNLLRLQMDAKKISSNIVLPSDVLVTTDKDMIHLVIRNLLSNAIKFTPAKGHIEIGFTEFETFIEVYVQDAGIGISQEALEKIKQKIFYTTTGTSSETGTGLGLMLCNEFLAKNKSQLKIESVEGHGSIFSFALQKLVVV